MNEFDKLSKFEVLGSKGEFRNGFKLRLFFREHERLSIF